MKDRYKLFRRINGIFYFEDKRTGVQKSLNTKNSSEARHLISAKNQSASQPSLNLALAKAFLEGKSPLFASRTWGEVMQEIAQTYHGPSLIRWQRVTKSKPFSLLHALPLVETDSSHFLQALRHPKAGTSTNVWLRRLHNFAMDMGWLLTPVLPKAAWPKIKYKTRFAITEAEHKQIITSEQNPMRRLFYEMLWETGGSQTDIATLTAANIDHDEGVLFYHRSKLVHRGAAPARIKIGQRLAELLSQLPKEGSFFPVIAKEAPEHRSTEFSRRCRVAGIKGRTLHSYRYAWAERAMKAGMPEREAMSHLGHKSSAIHHAYAKKAHVVTMPLEYYEAEKAKKIVQFPATTNKETFLKKIG